MKKNIIERIGKNIFHLLIRFTNEEVSSSAAALVYTTLLSMVPMAMVCVTVFSTIPWFAGVGEKIQAFVVANFVSDSANSILEQLNHFVDNLQQLSWTNVIFLFVTSVLLVYNMSSAFNRIWKVQAHQSYVRSFSIYTVVVMATPLLLGTVFVLSTYLASLRLVMDVDRLPYFKSTFLHLASYSVTFIIFTLFNWILPMCRVRWKEAAIGGLVTAILFELAKFGFGVYLKMVPTYHLIYGALATIPLFLLWLYISWVIILFGALVSHSVAIRFSDVHGYTFIKS